MANTKVTGDLIAVGTITTSNIANGTITATNIASGGLDSILSSYLTTNTYATEGYVTTAVANLVDAAPSTLDTLNELAAALGDDPNFATTVTNSIATKLPLAGGNITGNFSVDTNTLYVDAASNQVGIGTASPAYPLHIDNSIGASIRLTKTTTHTDGLFIGMDGNNSYFINYESGFSAFYNNGSEKMRITGSGNVGIGTSSPSAPLDIAHDMFPSTANFDLQASKTAYGNINFKGIANTGAITQQQGITWEVVDYDGTTDYGVQAQIAVGNNGTAGTFMGFFTTNSYGLGPIQRLHINSEGNVGIGTSSPDTLLHIESAQNSIIRLTDNDGSVENGSISGKIEFENFDAASGGVNAYIAGVNEGIDGNIRLAFGTGSSNSPAERMSITSSGNVGIGTTAAEQLLTVGDTVSGAINTFHQGLGVRLYFGLKGSDRFGAGNSAYIVLVLSRFDVSRSTFISGKIYYGSDRRVMVAAEVFINNALSTTNPQRRFTSQRSSLGGFGDLAFISFDYKGQTYIGLRINTPSQAYTSQGATFVGGCNQLGAAEDELKFLDALRYSGDPDVSNVTVLTTSGVLLSTSD